MFHYMKRLNFLKKLPIILFISASTCFCQWSWTNQFSGITEQLYSITYGKGLFIAVGDSCTIVSSPDGITWTERYSQSTRTHLYCVAFGNGVFVATGDNGEVITSSDGISWTKKVSGITTTLAPMSFNNGQFLASTGSGSVGSGCDILTSQDGTDWKIKSTDTTLDHITLLSFSYGNGHFIAVGFNHVILRSSDAISWSIIDSGISFPPSQNLYSVTYGNGTFIAVGNEYSKGIGSTILTSTDGASWSAKNFPLSTVALYSIAYGNGQFVTVGIGDTILSFGDGTNWISSKNVGGDLNSVTYGNGLFVAVGWRGTIIMSSALAARGVSKIISKFNFELNIRRSSISITFPSRIYSSLYSVEMFSPLGQRCFSSRLATNQGILDIPSSFLSTGIYLLSIKDNKCNSIESFRIPVQLK